jgi:hypothetical protein
MEDDPKRTQSALELVGTNNQKKQGFFARIFANFKKKNTNTSPPVIVQQPTELNKPEPQVPEQATPEKDNNEQDVPKEQGSKKSVSAAGGKKLVTSKSAEKEGAPKKSNIAQMFEVKMAEKEMEQKMSKKSFKDDFKSDIKVADAALKLKASGKPMPIMGLTMNIKKLNQLSLAKGLEEESLNNDLPKNPDDVIIDDDDAPVRFIDLAVSKELLEAPIKPPEPLKDAILDRPVIGQKNRRPAQKLKPKIQETSIGGVDVGDLLKISKEEEKKTDEDLDRQTLSRTLTKGFLKHFKQSSSGVPDGNIIEHAKKTEEIHSQELNVKSEVIVSNDSSKDALAESAETKTSPKNEKSTKNEEVVSQSHITPSDVSESSKIAQSAIISEESQKSISSASNVSSKIVPTADDSGSHKSGKVAIPEEFRKSVSHAPSPPASATEESGSRKSGKLAIPEEFRKSVSPAPSSPPAAAPEESGSRKSGKLAIPEEFRKSVSLAPNSPPAAASEESGSRKSGKLAIPEEFRKSVSLAPNSPPAAASEESGSRKSGKLAIPEEFRKSVSPAPSSPPAAASDESGSRKSGKLAIPEEFRKSVSVSPSSKKELRPHNK